MLLLNKDGIITHLTILVLGPEGVGKTSLITSFITFSKPKSSSRTTQKFSAPESCHFLQLLQSKNSTDSFTPNNSRVSLIIIEVAGSTSYELLYPSAILSADAFILVYDLIVKTKQQNASKIPIILVGNKVDTVSAGSAIKQIERPGLVPRQVSTDYARRFAETLGIPNHETTAQAPQSVSIIFKTLISISQSKSSHNLHLGNEHTSQSPMENRRISNESTAIPQQFTSQSRRPSQASSITQDGFRNSQQSSHSSNSTVASYSGELVSSKFSLQPPALNSVRYKRDILYKKYIDKLAISSSRQSKTNQEITTKGEPPQFTDLKKHQQDSGICIRKAPDITIQTSTESENIEHPAHIALRRTSNANKHRRSETSISPISPSPRTPDLQKNLKDTMDELDLFRTDALLNLGMFGKFESKSGFKTDLELEVDQNNEGSECLSERDDVDEEEEKMMKERKMEMERKRRSMRNVGLLRNLLQDGDKEDVENN
ncbi:hypothetical protein HK096_010959 [Nowakowskiella sp. JEL0078]|nr:hypothetical protein HK096_010959 [Nowakowskiella sp. JEL0078]